MTFSTLAPRALWIILPLCAVSLLFYFGHRRNYELDINSGRLRESPGLWSYSYNGTVHETSFSRLLARSGVPLRPPVWRLYKSEGGPRGWGRTGRLMAATRDLADYMPALGMPEQDQMRFAITALRCMQAGDGFYLKVDFDNPMLELYAGNGAPLERWPTSPQTPPPPR
jgi:hypothetical protein